MSAYIILEIIILFITLLYCLVPTKGVVKRGIEVNKSSYWFIVLMLLTFFIGLRGDFSTDYSNYVYSFYRYRNMTLGELLSFSDKEIGFKLLEWMIGIFTDNSVVLFVICSLITGWAYITFIRHYSPIKWFSLLMLLCVGSFFFSTNIMRSIMAAALVGLTYQYAIKKELVKYIVTVLLISLIHQSALIMIPLYFVLQVQWKKKYTKVMILVLLLVIVTISAFSNQITAFMMNFFYSDFSYGLDTGLSFTNIFKVLVVTGFIVLEYKKIDLENSTERVLFYCSLLYFATYMCATQIYILQRFAHFFSMAPNVLIPIIISKEKNTKKRWFEIFAWVVFLLMYSVLSMGDTEYFFIWQN